ncbi:11511_t:CDS:2 [Entrophospora sp. SA101]|nr:11511_t:CDS:2 [Entrophospora sp. SA101]
MATCVSKKIENVLAIPANYNNIPLFNPNNIESSSIISRLTNDYKGHFDLSYNYIKKEWIQNEMINENNFNQLEVLSVHLYGANIEEKKEERSMKTVRILDIKEQNLLSVH